MHYCQQNIQFKLRVTYCQCRKKQEQKCNYLTANWKYKTEFRTPSVIVKDSLKNLRNLFLDMKMF